MANKIHTDITNALFEVNLQDIITDEALTTLQVKLYKKNETVIISDDELRYLYIVIDGRVAIHNYSDQGNVAIVDYVEKNGVLGDLEFFQQCNYLHTAVAVVPSTILLIPLEIVHSHLTHSVSFLSHMCTVLTDKLMKSSVKNARSLLYPAKNKLCKYILQTADKLESLTIPFVMKDISSIMGISDRHIRRLLSHLVEEQIIMKENRTIKVLDMEQLHRYSTDF
ncbi:Crp/Fnr family transcriptional regulator [Paenibacillus sp. USHLN196]|jgi:CRP/FNR family transcriptional regulator, putaive post-exponential-phase nitrogen-starvation regulator|uniref:Crp/Fnr family transcriptional regulator n=1 Tax=Paenibacillus sp. USHLN196 TaxID=3081291 RepID=UPI003018E978